MFRLLDRDLPRSLCWRIARRLYCWARRDGANSPEQNGEYWLVQQVLLASDRNTVHCIDVGAHLGHWTAHARRVAQQLRRPLHVIAVEPALDSFEHLCSRFAADAGVAVRRFALSDRNGSADLFVAGALQGTNSLHPMAGYPVVSTQRVDTLCLDDLLEAEQLASIRFVKCDAEGHDLCVLRGAARSLHEGRIDVWQFEYNSRWLAQHATLRDVFDFIADKPYRLGKVFANGIELIPAWHPELERFFEANYALVRNGLAIGHLCRAVHFDAHNVLVRIRDDGR